MGCIGTFGMSLADVAVGNLTRCPCTSVQCTFILCSSLSIHYRINMPTQFCINQWDTSFTVSTSYGDFVRLSNQKQNKHHLAERFPFDKSRISDSDGGIIASSILGPSVLIWSSKMEYIICAPQLLDWEKISIFKQLSRWMHQFSHYKFHLSLGQFHNKRW